MFTRSFHDLQKKQVKMKLKFTAELFGQTHKAKLKVNMTKLDALGYDGVRYRRKIAKKFFEAVGLDLKQFAPPEKISLWMGREVIRTLIDSVDYD
jgi:hypothetical protein